MCQSGSSFLATTALARSCRCFWKSLTLLHSRVPCIPLYTLPPPRSAEGWALCARTLAHLSLRQALVSLKVLTFSSGGKLAILPSASAHRCDLFAVMNLYVNVYQTITNLEIMLFHICFSFHHVCITCSIFDSSVQLNPSPIE